MAALLIAASAFRIELTPYDSVNGIIILNFLLNSPTDTGARLSNKKLFLNVPDYLLLHNLIL